ncbi:DUF2924 domain-containing protein [Polynucleobacter brandtiae]|uniref:DUF2924 domain-containing protein n=1 Tax=Polynucleobacter brandtiae TaxID=1938816 RepID=A0A2M8VJG8_9BURK|nr:DUF2924 domain-containing protein [Polynucleobacter brandtiae]PJI77143.1 Protein of unknown function (DUF2924) [Polynucleobacter brandtiae]
MKAALQELQAMSRAELAKEWQVLFEVPAPHLARENILRGAIAWQIQAKAMGGLSGSEKRQLQSGKPISINQPAIGSRLIRVWKDQTHQVTVLADGYLHEDQIYKSLSAIAKAITGTAWSGPVFFGLKK